MLPQGLGISLLLMAAYFSQLIHWHVHKVADHLHHLLFMPDAANGQDGKDRKTIRLVDTLTRPQSAKEYHPCSRLVHQ
jgi:hypothetical protein